MYPNIFRVAGDPRPYWSACFIGVVLALTSNPGVPGAPKCQQMQTSSQWIHMTKRENNWKPVFHIWAKMLKKKRVYFLPFEGPWEGGGWPSIIRLGPSCFPAILSPMSMYMWNKEAIWYKLFTFKSKIWKIYLGGSGGPLRQTQDYKIFRAVRPHHRADKCITREQNNYSFSYMAPNVKVWIFGNSGGLGGP